MSSRCKAAFAAWIIAAVMPLAEANADDVTQSAARFGKANTVVQTAGQPTLICEAEEFAPDAAGGWRALNWGDNYYAATFANSFLSRKAFLGAHEQCETSTAARSIRITDAGRYQVLVRYEAAYRFETQFRLQIEQNGKLVLDRLYGARKNPKIWAFRQGVTPEVAWSWGAVENVVWEGHDAFAQLAAGAATVKLIAEGQPEPAARRNVDLVMLTTDTERVNEQLEKARYLPLDGMLTQQGDLYARLHNHADSSEVTLAIPPCTEHSPYWVHVRAWKPVSIACEPGKTSPWTEVGSLLDSLCDGQWALASTGNDAVHYTVEFGVPAGGGFESIGKFETREKSLRLAYDANTRYTGRIRTQDQVLYDLVEYLKQHPVPGSPPVRTGIFGYTFAPRPGDTKYTAARDAFLRMIPIATSLTNHESQRRGYIDVRSLNHEQLEAKLKQLKADGQAAAVEVVSLGDEIGLPAPEAGDHEGFRAWLQSQGLKPADADVAAGGDWTKVIYSPAAETAQTNPSLYYYSRKYQHAYGIETLKSRTDLIRKYLPNAGVGANFSPHHGNVYLGETHKWVHLFRRGGMTMPWSEDYIWQVPVGTQQMNFINLDLFRAGIKGRPEAKIHYYVMPHTPGNTPSRWRRQFYGDLGHGMKIVNLFEFDPVQLAYTENHSSNPDMYVEVRRALNELSQFEDVIQDGQIAPGVAALWFSETGDIWNDFRPPFAAAKRALYIAIRHQQLPLDFVTEPDAVAGDLKNYRVLYLADQHVSRAASKAIVDWVAAGGQLLATAGAGMFDERNQPNETLRELLGVTQAALDAPEENSVTFIKQDLPFAEPLDAVTWTTEEGTVQMPVIGARSRITAAGAEVHGKFSDGSPAITMRSVDEGTAVYCAFLPSLAYFKPAIPRRPVDRGSSDAAMAHFIPTDFDAAAAALVGLPAAEVPRPVECSNPLVETTIVRAKQGVVIPLVNWSDAPIEGLRVTVRAGIPHQSAKLAGGGEVKQSEVDGRRVFQLDLDAADALILR